MVAHQRYGERQRDDDGAQAWPAARQDQQQGVSASALLGAVARVRRSLGVVVVAMTVLEAVWVVLGNVRAPLGTFLVAAVAVAVLLASVWLLLGRMVRSGPGLMVVWVGGGYLLRLAILGAALVGGRVLALDTRVIGVSLILAVLAGMACETAALVRVRGDVDPAPPGGQPPVR
ncbi:pseudouridine synthase [Actinomyces wuliandei]|uniref:pseudouridine synthase n=1 Tax=Actinomyces wuliandei TaxID=2057743 RepID=UPI000FD711A7|nr:pseudouridine synthase [Actinomyces wuliandei]